MTFTAAMDHVAKAFEVLGAAVLVLGLLLSLSLAGRVWWRTRRGRVAYQTLRETFGAYCCSASRSSWPPISCGLSRSNPPCRMWSSSG